MQILLALWPVIRPLIEFLQNPAKIKENPKGFATYLAALVITGIGLWRPEFITGEYETLIYGIIYSLLPLAWLVYGYFSRLWRTKTSKPIVNEFLQAEKKEEKLSDKNLI
jgi:hypothetical protein